MINSSRTILALLILVLSSCMDNQSGDTERPRKPETFTTKLGKVISIPAPTPEVYDLYQQAKKDYIEDSLSIDHIIWYGRRAAYLPRYQEAIEIYTKGIARYPDEPRLYRHRGHRYISIREFEKAVADLERAAELIEGTENQIEPDGLPNPQGIPISTLHGNIWYHLGLAYYLKHDLENAYRAYLNCRNAHANDDNLVSSTHWLYMIQRRLDNDSLAAELLTPINQNMNIIENFGYYDLCRFYKELIPMDSLSQDLGSAGDAVKYGLANWDLYNGNLNTAKKKMEKILEGTTWNSFGYIAAESDYLYYFE